MEDLVLSCLESRVEENRNLYARFLVGPFLRGDALTVATALRRVLLSSIESIGITALSIQGITHEFSTIVGVRESVLELSLNFGAIVLSYDKTCFQKKGFFDKLQIGYLQVQGPKVVYANNLKLPLGVKLVDPTQYIATVSREGSIVLKFTIGKRNNFLHKDIGSGSHFENQSKELSILGEIDKKNIARAKKRCSYKNSCTPDPYFEIKPSKSLLYKKRFTPNKEENQDPLQKKFTQGTSRNPQPYKRASVQAYKGTSVQARDLYPCLASKTRTYGPSGKRFVRRFVTALQPLRTDLRFALLWSYRQNRGVQRFAQSRTNSANWVIFQEIASFAQQTFTRTSTGHRLCALQGKGLDGTHIALCKRKVCPLVYKAPSRGEEHGEHPKGISCKTLFYLLLSVHQRCNKTFKGGYTFHALIREVQNKALLRPINITKMRKALLLYTLLLPKRAHAKLRFAPVSMPPLGRATLCLAQRGKQKKVVSLVKEQTESLCLKGVQNNESLGRHKASKGESWACKTSCNGSYRSALHAHAPVHAQRSKTNQLNSLLPSLAAGETRSGGEEKSLVNKVFQSNICLRNVIPLDLSLTPVLKVNFVVEVDDEVLYLRQKVRERIILEVWTNGSIHPTQAVHDAALRLLHIFDNFRDVYKQ